MIKTILKEGAIVLLLLVAVVLILGILFYEYIPNNKTVPIEIEEYALSEDIKNELKETVSEGQNIVKTFYIDSTDLDLYESTSDYDKGKANPFADYTVEKVNTITNTTGNNQNTTTDKNDTVVNNTDVNTNKNEVYMTTPGKNY